jgi:hypothetical protein
MDFGRQAPGSLALIGSIEASFLVKMPATVKARSAIVTFGQHRRIGSTEANRELAVVGLVFLNDDRGDGISFA